MGLQQLAPQVVPIRFRHCRFAAESRRNPLYTYDETALDFFNHPFPLQIELGLLPDIPGRTHGEDAFIAAGEKHPFQKPGTLIVEEVFVPFVLHELRYDHDNVASGMLFRKVDNELNDGNDDEAVGGRQGMELGRLLACRAEGSLNVVFPVLLKQFGVLGELDVQGDDFRGKPGGKFNSLAGDIAPAVDGNDRNRRLAETCHVDGILAGGKHLDRMVVSTYEDEDNNNQRNEEQRNPCALNELCNQHDNDGDAGDETAQPIDEYLPLPMRTVILPPVHDHAGL